MCCCRQTMLAQHVSLLHGGLTLPVGLRSRQLCITLDPHSICCYCSGRGFRKRRHPAGH